jgi:hypothetical protein
MVCDVVAGGEAMGQADEEVGLKKRILWRAVGVCAYVTSGTSIHGCMDGCASSRKEFRNFWPLNKQGCHLQKAVQGFVLQTAALPHCQHSSIYTQNRFTIQARPVPPRSRSTICCCRNLQSQVYTRRCIGRRCIVAAGCCSWSRHGCMRRS